MQKYILIPIGILTLSALLGLAVKMQEKKECHQWSIQAQSNPSFYLTRWQAQQCKAHNINVNAPTKN